MPRGKGLRCDIVIVHDKAHRKCFGWWKGRMPEVSPIDHEIAVSRMPGDLPALASTNALGTCYHLITLQAYTMPRNGSCAKFAHNPTHL